MSTTLSMGCEMMDLPLNSTTKMNPDLCLTQLRDLCEKALAGGLGKDEKLAELAEKIAATFQTFDEFLSKGGTIPLEWC